MSRENKKFKNISNFGDVSKSERRKYIETLMAQMGLVDLSELTREERVRWIAAATPSDNIEAALIEMGYSMDSNDNLPSLGPRISSISSEIEQPLKTNYDYDGDYLDRLRKRLRKRKKKKKKKNDNTR